MSAFLAAVARHGPLSPVLAGRVTAAGTWLADELGIADRRWIDAGFARVFVASPEHMSVPGITSDASGRRHLVLVGSPCRHGTLMGPDEARRLLADLGDGEDDGPLRELDTPSAALFVNVDERLVKLATDVVGLQMTYQAETDGVWLCSSSSLAIARVLASDLSPERTCEFLAMGQFAGTHTYFDAIDTVRGGAVVTLRDGERRERRSASLSQIAQDLDDDRAASGALVEAIRAATRTRLAGREAVLELTAGLDSRLVAGALDPTWIGPRTTTWTVGDSGSTDARLAALVAEAAGLPHSVSELGPLDAERLLGDARRIVVRSSGEQAPLPHALFVPIYRGKKSLRIQASGLGGEHARGACLPAVAACTSDSPDRWLRLLVKHRLVGSNAVPRHLLKGGLPDLVEHAIEMQRRFLDEALIHDRYACADDLYLYHLDHRFSGMAVTAAGYEYRATCPLFSESVLRVARRIPHARRFDGYIARKALAELAPRLVAVPLVSGGKPARLRPGAHNWRVRRAAMLADRVLLALRRRVLGSEYVPAVPHRVESDAARVLGSWIADAGAVFPAHILDGDAIARGVATSAISNSCVARLFTVLQVAAMVRGALVAARPEA